MEQVGGTVEQGAARGSDAGEEDHLGMAQGDCLLTWLAFVPRQPRAL